MRRVILKTHLPSRVFSFYLETHLWNANTWHAEVRHTEVWDADVWHADAWYANTWHPDAWDADARDALWKPMRVHWVQHLLTLKGQSKNKFIEQFDLK